MIRERGATRIRLLMAAQAKVRWNSQCVEERDEKGR
jgi:hypothetical protein